MILTLLIAGVLGCSRPTGETTKSRGATATTGEAAEGEASPASSESAGGEVGDGDESDKSDKEGLNLGGLRVKLRVDNDPVSEPRPDPFARPPEPVKRPVEKDAKGRRVEARD